MTNLPHAISIAAQAHGPQRDRMGESYILHPLRVMLAMRTEDERIVAVLHDVIEDTDWTFERLKREGFGSDIIEAVDHLTRRTHETYEGFIERAASHPVALLVKLADIHDNLRPERAAGCPPQLRARYETALRVLRSACLDEVVELGQEMEG